MRTPTEQLDPATKAGQSALNGVKPAQPEEAVRNSSQPQPIKEPHSEPQASLDDAAELPAEPSAARRKLQEVLAESPSWLASAVVHMTVLLILALWYLPSVPELTMGLLESLPSDTEEADDIAELEPVELDPTELQDLPETLEVQPDTDVISEAVDFSTVQDLAAPPSFQPLADFGMEMATESLTANIGPIGTNGIDGRGASSRAAMVRRGGGNEATEIAVAMALKWLAEHQNPDGSWSLDHTGGKCQGRCQNPGTIRDGNIAATSLALLPFLGAGQTHTEGKYKQVVTRGLDALIRMGKETKNGVSWRDGGTMYSHGLASIALCEALGMSHDDRLYIPAQASLAYIVYAQDPKGGGWRYSAPATTGGDTSVVGWQIMALKSGHLAGLGVPRDTILKAGLFLDSASSENGARYSYLPEPGRPGTDTLSAVGLLSRMYMGWKNDNPALKDGVERLAKSGPSRNNYYYNYYAAQVLFQYTGGTGDMWKKWNEALRDQLLTQQSKDGHEKGSWYVAGAHNPSGGRIFTTSLATMTLEVYYRYMPIYQTDAVESEFPE